MESAYRDIFLVRPEIIWEQVGVSLGESPCGQALTAEG